MHGMLDQKPSTINSNIYPSVITLYLDRYYATVVPNDMVLLASELLTNEENLRIYTSRDQMCTVTSQWFSTFDKLQDDPFKKPIIEQEQIFQMI